MLHQGSGTYIFHLLHDHAVILAAQIAREGNEKERVVGTANRLINHDFGYNVFHVQSRPGLLLAILVRLGLGGWLLLVRTRQCRL